MRVTVFPTIQILFLWLLFRKETSGMNSWYRGGKTLLATFDQSSDETGYTSVISLK